MDKFFWPDKLGDGNERREYVDRMLNSMTEKKLIIMESIAEGIIKAREGSET